MSTPTRKFVAMLMLLAGLILYCLIVMRLMADVSHWSLWIKTFCYLFFGIIWIFPCYKLLTWMETGKWQVKQGKP
jgi:putative flippase GtrA